MTATVHLDVAAHVASWCDTLAQLLDAAGPDRRRLVEMCDLMADPETVVDDRLVWLWHGDCRIVAFRYPTIAATLETVADDMATVAAWLLTAGPVTA